MPLQDFITHLFRSTNVIETPNLHMNSTDKACAKAVPVHVTSAAGLLYHPWLCSAMQLKSGEQLSCMSLDSPLEFRIHAACAITITKSENQAAN